MAAASLLPWLDIATALWLGLLTSISPCPLASNVAAVSYLARFCGSRRRQLWAGCLYALGRALAYTLVGGVLSSGLASAPALSGFLQRHGDQLLGPLLLLVGMALCGLLPGLPSFGGVGSGAQERLARGCLLGSLGLGFVLALAFCPVSAGLFFGLLIPLAVDKQAVWLLPAVYGGGTAAPALLFALLLLLGRSAAGRWLARVQRIDRWLLPATGWLLLGVGVWLCLHRTLAVL